MDAQGATRREPFSLGGVSVPPGKTQVVKLHTGESYLNETVSLPVVVIHGEKPGPTAFVCAAVHGNEINGVDIVRRLIRRLETRSLAGTLLAVPVVNVEGFRMQSRYLPDGRDLNRNFDGNSSGTRSGSTARRIANLFLEEVIRRCDFGIDLHTAGKGRMNLPHVRADLARPKVRALAEATGSAILIGGAGPPGTLRREATDAGVPTVIFEAGEPSRFDPKVSRAGLKMVLNVLCARKMIEPEERWGIPFDPPFQLVLRKRAWVRAKRGGILSLKVSPGDLVYEGGPVAVVLNPYGRKVSVLRAPFDGMVIGITREPLAASGTAVAHVARLEDSLGLVERSFVEHGRSWKKST